MGKEGEFLARFHDVIVAMRADGLSQRAIGKELGCNQASVSNYLRKNGLGGYSYSYWDNPTDHQKNLLLGSLLGDGNLTLMEFGHNPFLQFCHGLPQKDYLIWKAEQFGKLFTHTKPNEYLKDDGNWVVSVSSRCHPWLKTYYDRFYVRPDSECTEHIYKKMVTEKILADVNDEALAIWWCDDGSAQRFNGSLGRRDAILWCLGAMTEGEYELVEYWFQNQGYNPTRKNWLDDGNSVQLRFSADESEDIVNRILPYIPSCMRSKLGGLARRLV